MASTRHGSYEGLVDLELLHETEMSRVYSAIDQQTNLRVIVRARTFDDSSSWAQSRYFHRLRHNTVTNAETAILSISRYFVADDGSICSVLPDASYRPLDTYERIGKDSVEVQERWWIRIFAHLALSLSECRPWYGHHNNLKPGNVLLHHEKPPRLCDADSAPFPLHPDAFHPANQALLFASPKLLTSDSASSDWVARTWRQRRNSEGTSASDVFSLAALLAWVLGGDLPDRALLTAIALNPNESLRLSQDDRLPVKSSDELRSLLRNSMSQDPDARPEGLREFATMLAGLLPQSEEEDETDQTSHEWNLPVLSHRGAPDTNEFTMLEEEAPETDIPPYDLNNLLPADRTAAGIRAELDRYVVGQEMAKEDLAVLLSMHLSWWQRQDRLHRAPNSLAFGKTGVGKTHSLQVAARYLNLPYAVVDATSLVPSGIVGMQMEDVLEALVGMADSILNEREVPRRQDDDIELARRGVIYLDEFDKLSTREVRDHGPEAVQRRLLKMVEGTLLTVGQKRHTVDNTRYIDTTGILFIASGAFNGLESQQLRNERTDSIRRKLKDENVIISQDIINLGFIPELVARFQILINYHDLLEHHFLEILESPEISPIGVWRNHFESLEKTLTVTPEAMRAIAKRAVYIELGARGIQQILFGLLRSVAYRFEASAEKEYVLTESEVMKGWRKD